MFSNSTILIILATFQSVLGQFFGGPGGNGGFFGCGQNVRHVGNECYQPETGKGTVICVGKYKFKMM